jgi:vacuolar protein sorting-associated protein 13A/C
VSATGHNTIGIKFLGKPWEQISNIAVDKEGEYTYVLRPRLDKILHRMLCEIVVENNVKIVTLRSTYNVFNGCSYPMELVLVDANNKPAQPVQKIGMSFQCNIQLSHSIS